MAVPPGSLLESDTDTDRSNCVIVAKVMAIISLAIRIVYHEQIIILPSALFSISPGTTP